LVAGFAAVIVAAVVAFVARAVLRDRRRMRERDDLVLVLGILASELEAGTAPAVAVRAAADAAPGFEPALLDMGRGAVRPRRLEDVHGGSGGPAALESLAVAWRISDETGAPLADVVAQVRRDLEADRALHRAVAVAVAGPRSSAGLLALLPVLGVGLGVAIGARPLAVLLGATPGRMLLIAGLLLDALGVVWSHRIVRRAQPT
jgi:tight adherence protein B